MSQTPRSFRRKIGTTSLFGTTLGTTLLLGLAASAQNGGITPVPAAPVPAPPEAQAPAADARGARPRLDLQFVDIEVARLLQIIAENFNVDISVADDVTGTLRSINLRDKTPEQAIQLVVMTAGLQYRKTEDGTYLVGKNLPGGNQAPAAAAPAAPPAAGISNPLGGGFNRVPLPSDNAHSLPGFGTNPLEAGITPSNRSMWPGAGVDTSGGFRNADAMPQLMPPRRTQVKRHRSVTVRNVRPGILAYWLDPANNEYPREFRKSDDSLERSLDRSFAKPALSPQDMASINGNGAGLVTPQISPSFNSNAYIPRNSTNAGTPETRWTTRIIASPQFAPPGGPGGTTPGARGGAGGTFQLPEGVERIVAIDPQNALLVLATDEGFRDLQEIIGILDRPLRQVEIEAQFVTVSTSDSRAFGIDYSSSQGNFNFSTNGFAPGVAPGTVSVGMVRGNFQATLRALQASNRAKVITAPRVLAINNLTASLESTTATPIILTSSTSNIGGNVGQTQNLIYITTSIGLTVTPTINNDDTITVLMQPNFSSQSPSGLAIPAPVISEQFVDTIANVRDGDTIALGGLRTANISVGGQQIPLIGSLPFIGKLFRSRNATDQQSELIIFLTARIIRRADDISPIAPAG